MIHRKQLAILWAVVIVLYAGVLLSTNPNLTMPREERHAVYEAYRDGKERADELCWPPPEIEVAEAFGLTNYQVLLIVKHAPKEGWEPILCDKQARIQQIREGRDE